MGRQDGLGLPGQEKQSLACVGTWPSGGNAEGLWRLLEDGARPCPGARGLLAGPARRHRAPTQGGGHTQCPRSTVGDPEAPQFPGLLKTDTKSSMQVIFPVGQKVPSNPGTQVAGVVATWGAARSLASPNSSWPHFSCLLWCSNQLLNRCRIDPWILFPLDARATS